MFIWRVIRFMDKKTEGIMKEGRIWTHIIIFIGLQIWFGSQNGFDQWFKTLLTTGLGYSIGIMIIYFIMKIKNK